MHDAFENVNKRKMFYYVKQETNNILVYTKVYSNY